MEQDETTREGRERARGEGEREREQNRTMRKGRRGDRERGKWSNEMEGTRDSLRKWNPYMCGLSENQMYSVHFVQKLGIHVFVKTYPLVCIYFHL